MTQSTTIPCTACGATVAAGERFCGRCGSSVASPTATEHLCPWCGVGVLASDRFCPSCGTSLGATAPSTGVSASPWDVVLRRLSAATIGEFELKRELGRGGMAAVYLAHEIALNRKVALKVMAPGVMMAEGMVERFRLEAVTVANLSHPNIVRVHAVRQVGDDLHFIVMQYIAGRTLERVLREVGPLPIPVIRTILGQVGSALAHAHKRGVVHRDVKPGNIMLDGAGDVVVTDFGIAKVATATSHTLTGSVVGTPSYMSPEQCFAQPLTGASDQYSLGVVAFEMLTGRVPFTGAAYAVMHGHTHGEIPPVRDLRPDCPDDLENAVVRMLSKAPDARFPSMADAAAACGSPTLGEHDPLRQDLAQLAAADEAALLDALYPTPVSPVPQTRPSMKPVAGRATPAQPAAAPGLLSVAWRPAHTPAEPATPVPSASPAPPQPAPPAGAWTAARVAAWTIPFALAAGGTAIFFARSQLGTETRSQPAVAAPVTMPPSDSEPLLDSAAIAPASGAAGDTAEVREPPPLPPRLPPRAASAAAPPATRPQPVPQPRTTTPSQTAPPARDSARANTPANTPATTDPPPASVPVTATPIPAAPVTPAELRAELDAVVASYARAIEAEDVARLRSIYPGISREQVDGFRSFFEVARDIRIAIGRVDAPAQLQPSVGSEARVRVEYRIEYFNTSLRRTARETAGWQAVLERTTTGWRVLSIR